jgi:hypothetical protein
MIELPRFFLSRTSATEPGVPHYVSSGFEAVTRNRYIGVEPASVVLGPVWISGVCLTTSSSVALQKRESAEPSIEVLALMKRTEELRALPFPGRPMPSADARLVASLVLPETVEFVVPDRISTTSDGGIMFYFLGRGELSGRRYASLEIHESGELVMLRSDRDGGSMPLVEEVPLGPGETDAALQKIRAFIDPAWLAQ